MAGKEVGEWKWDVMGENHNKEKHRDLDATLQEAGTGSRRENHPNENGEANWTERSNCDGSKSSSDQGRNKESQSA